LFLIINILLEESKKYSLSTPLRLYSSFVLSLLYDVDEAPTIQLSNSTILNGSAAYTRIGQITANDVEVGFVIDQQT
jgi:hypothetical protein